MCVVTKKTYIDPRNRREVEETTYHLCEKAIGDRPCGNLKKRSEKSSRVQDRYTAGTRQLSAPDIVTASGQHWQQVQRPSSKRKSSSRESKSNISSPVDSVAGTPSPTLPVYQEVNPPLMSGGLPSARHSGTVSPASPTGTVSYPWPPPSSNRQSPQADRPGLHRLSSFSSTNAEVDKRESASPTYSIARKVVKPAASSSKGSQTGGKGKGKSSHARADSHRDSYDAIKQKQEDQENEVEAQMERDRLVATDRRQAVRFDDAEQARIERARLKAVETRRLSNLAAENAKKIREDLDRDRHRQEAVAALEGRHHAESDAEDDEYDQLKRAELSAINREQATAARLRDSLERYQATRSSVSSHNTSFTSPPASPSSARHGTVSKKHRVAVHNPPASSTSRRSSALSERGEKVIAREQGRVVSASRRLTEALDSLDIEDDGEMDTIIESELERRRRLRREDERR